MKNKLHTIITIALLATIVGCKQPVVASRVMDDDMDNLIETLKQGDSSGLNIDEAFGFNYNETKRTETLRIAKIFWGKIARANIIRKTHVGLVYYYWVDFTTMEGKSVRVRTEYRSWNGTMGLYLKLAGG